MHLRFLRIEKIIILEKVGARLAVFHMSEVQQINQFLETVSSYQSLSAHVDKKYVQPNLQGVFTVPP